MKRLLTILLGAALAAGAFQAIGPGRAEPAAAQAPLTRIQVVILRVHVLDDSDDLTWGELFYSFRLMRVTSTCEGYACTGDPAIGPDEFRLSVPMSATTSQVRGIYQVLGGEQGLALYPTDRMAVGMAGAEEDWDGPGVNFCPIEPYNAPFDDSLCGAHDKLGVVHNYFNGPNFGVGTHSQTVYKGFDATYRVDYEIRRVGATTAAVTGGGSGSATPRPSPTATPTPRPAPGTPPRHAP